MHGNQNSKISIYALVKMTSTLCRLTSQNHRYLFLTSNISRQNLELHFRLLNIFKYAMQILFNNQ